jgi:hypothetical protein
MVTRHDTVHQFWKHTDEHCAHLAVRRVTMMAVSWMNRMADCVWIGIKGCWSRYKIICSFIPLSLSHACMGTWWVGLNFLHLGSAAWPATPTYSSLQNWLISCSLQSIRTLRENNPLCAVWGALIAHWLSDMFNWSTESISQTMLSRQFQVVCSKLIMRPKLYPASRRIILFSTYILSRSQLRRGTKGITGCITNSGILQPHTCCISAFFHIRLLNVILSHTARDPLSGSWPFNMYLYPTAGTYSRLDHSVT